MITKAKDNNNFILSEKPFPTYVFEPSASIVKDKQLTKNMEQAYEKAYNLVDEANDDLKDFANNKASEFENKENSHDLDLARDLFRIYIKDGYNYGFSMILEFDDLFIDGITNPQRTELENSIKSYALSLMKDIATRVKMSLYGQESNDRKANDEESLESLKATIKELDLDLKEAVRDNNDKKYYELMGQRNDLVRKVMRLEKEERSKANDSSDIQVKLEIDESIARELIKNVSCNKEKITFKIEGTDFTIVHTDPIHHYFEDYDEGTFDSDEFHNRIQPDGDLYQEVIDELIGEDALLMIWI